MNMKAVAQFMAAGLMFLTACQSYSEGQQTSLQHPFVGCWQNEDGSAIEGWTEDPSGWLFGYAVNRDENNQVTFFEQMRVDGEGLVVIGPNDDPTRFELVGSGAAWIFENPEHDYPQRIIYYPSPGRLDAEISLMSGEKKVSFKKKACT